ncbi:hypothetical protein [Streptomyces chryseus]
MTADNQSKDTEGKTVKVTVDGEAVEVPKGTTPDTILSLAGIEVATYYLV